MSTDLLLSDGKARIVNGDFEAPKVEAEIIDGEHLRALNEAGKAKISLDGEKRTITILSESHKRVVVLSGNRDNAIQVLGNISLLGTINSPQINKMEKELTELRKKVTELEARLQQLQKS